MNLILYSVNKNYVFSQLKINKKNIYMSCIFFFFYIWLPNARGRETKSGRLIWLVNRIGKKVWATYQHGEKGNT
jgi:hypothetical protein